VNCEDVLRKLAEYLDDESRDELCRQIEGHLSRCKDCRIEVDSLKRTIVLYQADREMEMPVAISSTLQAALDREYEVLKLKRKPD